jgi:glycosyltransferase involved in cell wall biosynthesis
MVLSNLDAGGAETTALELLRRQRQAGLEVFVASIKDGLLRAHFAQSASAVIDAMIVVDAPRDGMFYGFLGSRLARRTITRICWCKSIPGGQSSPFVRHLRRYVKLGLVDAIICTSRRQRAALAERGLPKRKMPMIRNGVDLDRIERALPRKEDLPAGKRLIVQVANAMPDKDPGTLLRAAGLLAQRRDDFHFLLAGRRTDSAEMAHQATQAGAQGVVTLAGHCDDVPGLLKAADVFALSTTSEVFSVATLEAMAAGVPVVVSDIPAFEEMFTDGCEGLKVPPGNAEALANAIETLLDDPAGRRRLGEAGRKRAKDFDISRMVDNFHRLLLALSPVRSTNFR